MVQFALNHDALFLLVLLRMVAFVGTSPLLSLAVWPNWAKLGLAVYMALTVSPSISSTVPTISSNPGEFVLLALNETITGMLLGFVATVVFSTVTIAGQMIDVPIGFGSAILFNPQESQGSSITSNVTTFLFSVFFIGVNGLNGLLLSVMNSYRFMGIGYFHFPSHAWSFLVQVVGLAMTLAVEMAAPLIVALLLTDITFALMSRAVPQMNVYVVGLPAKLFVGLSLMAAAMPGMVYLFGTVFSNLFQELNAWLMLLKG